MDTERVLINLKRFPLSKVVDYTASTMDWETIQLIVESEEIPEDFYNNVYAYIINNMYYKDTSGKIMYFKSPSNSVIGSYEDSPYYDTYYFPNGDAIAIERDDDLPKAETEVIAEIKKRAELGKSKYGTTTDREDYSFEDWMQHAKEEILDLLIYIQKTLHTYKKVKKIL